jgi:hypothetical protein
MPKQHRIILSPRLLALREECAATGRGFGHRLTEIVTRYDTLMRQYSPRSWFEPEEWAAVLATLYRRWPESDMAATSSQHIAQVLAQAADDCRPEDYTTSSLLNGAADKVRAMGSAEALALVEEIYRELIETSPQLEMINE